jgi:dihydrofolate reductase
MKSHVVSLWDFCEPPKVTPQKSPTKVSEPKKERSREKKIEEKSKVKSKLFVILAGVSKATGRQLYVSTFEDCDEWHISVVPSVLTMQRAQFLSEKVNKYIEDNPKRYKFNRPTLTIESIENKQIFEQVRCLLR